MRGAYGVTLSNGISTSASLAGCVELTRAQSANEQNRAAAAVPPHRHQVRDPEAGRGKCVLRKRHFASSEFPDAERECAFWWREINSDDAAAGWLPWTRPRALTVGRGAQGARRSAPTHMALLLQLQKATGRWLAGWMGSWVCLQNRPPCGLSPFPLGAASHLHLPPIPIPRRRADSPSPHNLPSESLPSLPVCDFFDTSEPLVRTRLISEIAGLQQRPV